MQLKKLVTQLMTVEVGI